MNSFVMITLIFTFIFSSFLSVQSSQPFIYDVDYEGATGDGETNDTEVFMSTWQAICKSNASSSIFRVPHGKKYLVHPLTFNGECQSKNFTFQIDGKLIAPRDPSSWECGNKTCQNWITFEQFDGLIVRGNGSFHERGKAWWKLRCNQNKYVCSSSKKATTFAIVSSKNVQISGLTFVNSRRRHISIVNTSSVHISQLYIKTPKEGPDNDGIRIERSLNVTIIKSIIRTGMDCIGIGDGSKYIKINRIFCGQGRGISIGRLGYNGKNETVEYVNVRRIQFYATQNGVSIKTCQGGHGYARHIRFEHMKFKKVASPIIIDQFICPHQPCKNSSAVEINDVTFNDLIGASTNETAVKLLCSESIPCKKIRMKDIYLDYITQQGETRKAICVNVLNSTAIGEVHPDVPCLSKT